MLIYPYMLFLFTVPHLSSAVSSHRLGELALLVVSLEMLDAQTPPGHRVAPGAGHSSQSVLPGTG